MYSGKYSACTVLPCQLGIELAASIELFSMVPFILIYEYIQ